MQNLKEEKLKMENLKQHVQLLAILEQLFLEILMMMKVKF